MGYPLNANYNCEDNDCVPLPDYDETIELCSSTGRLAGASTFYLIECGNDLPSGFDVDTLETWADDGRATRISNIKLGFGAPSPIEIDPTTSCGTKQIINYTRTADIEDAKVGPVNTNFWSKAKRRKYEGAILVECPTSGLTNLITFINAEITLSAYRDFPNTNEQIQKYIAQLSWKDIEDPLQYNA